MYYCITVTPSSGYFGFNVKYCLSRITVPGFECLIDETQKISRRLKKMGCNKFQIDIILQIIKERRDSQVDETGEVKDESDCESDYESDCESDYESE